MNKKWKLSELFYNDRALMVIALITAVLSWVVVTLFIDPESTTSIQVPTVDLERQSASVTQLGLNPILLDQQEISVEVEGKSYIIGGLSEEDITVYARMTNITEPGTYDLELGYVLNTDRDFTVKSLRPSHVLVRFERMVTKTFPLTAEVTGLTVPEGYIKEQEVVTPGEVKVTGPEVDVARIAQAVVRVNAGEVKDQSLTINSEVLLLDASGNPVSSSYLRLDYDRADVTIPILQKKTIDLKVGFLNTPPGFDLDRFEYTLSNETLEIAGSKRQMESYSELTVGYVDFDALDLESSYVFDVTLPNGVVNVENVHSVSVEFPNEDRISRNFVVRNINLLNTPVNYKASVSTKSINNVRVIGPQEVVSAMTADDLVADIDLSSIEIATGQFSVPVKIYAPVKELVWVNGSYQALITVQEK